MKIGLVTAGAGEMLCGSCIRDNALARELSKTKHEVVFSPLYTPICTDEESATTEKQFYSGVNIYLQQKYPVFRRLPLTIDALLDSKKLTNILMKFGTD
ncbi:MAG: glycosyltransferase family 1 protein, partial [Thermoplasmata archaeon]|nr:glycosyltransferase family 1 protein [Thermoplasmata archaeon]